MVSWTLTEILIEQERAAKERISSHAVQARAGADGGLRGALAAALARLALVLDRGAVQRAAGLTRQEVS
jgi:hypothetical protein